MKNKLLIIALALPLVCLIGWSTFLGYLQFYGQEVKVVISGYDPRDLLSGHYISYQIDWHKTDCSQFENKTCPETEFCIGNCRYYIPEENAFDLDRLFRQNNDDNLVFEIIYAYKPNSEPIATQLLINGVNWQESLKPSI